MSEVLLLERTNHVATVTLNRPETLNALNLELKHALMKTLLDLRDDASIRAVVLTGSGRGFCVGQDLTEHAALLAAGDPSPLQTVAAHFNPIIELITELPKPVIAAVNGAAAGAGAGIAFACDLRIGAISASYLLAFANVGLALDSGVSWTLPRLLGVGKATELALLAEPITATQAAEFGLFSEVVPDAELMEAALQLATRLAGGPTAAFAAIKAELSYAATATLPATLALEAQLQGTLGTSNDHRAGVEAFLTKQRPEFTGD